MTATNLKDLCERFEEHCDKCSKCGLVIVKIIGTATVSLRITRVVVNKPPLCDEGKSLLLDLFN